MQKRHILAAIFVAVAVFVVGLWSGALASRFSRAVATTSKGFNTATILQQVKTLSQLVTVKFVFEKVVVVEDAKWYGENRVIIIANGVVKGGINLEKLEADDIQVSGEKVTIQIPKPIITDAYLDDRRTKVLERTTGIMRTFDKDLEQNARKQAVADLMKAARENNIDKEAEDRARSQITFFFRQLGFKEVEVKVK